jgi:hypothetical protein
MPADVAPGQRVPITKEATGWSAIVRPGTVPGVRSLGTVRASPTFQRGGEHTMRIEAPGRQG